MIQEWLTPSQIEELDPDEMKEVLLQRLNKSVID